jgi:hypothetical protein
MSRFRNTAASVRDTIGAPVSSGTPNKVLKVSRLATASNEVLQALGVKTAKSDVERNSEWQRVNSSIADVLKDSSVLFSKLARLQGDFTGPERDELEDIGNDVRSISDRLSKFSSEFYAGELNMRTPETPFSYGQAPPPPDAGPPTPTPPTPPREDEDFDVEAEISDEDSTLEAEFEKSE